MYRLSIFILFYLFTHLSGYGQDLADSVPSAYRNLIPLDLEVYSGGFYVDPPPVIAGDPYFIKKGFQKGSITINGLTYHGVPLMYNIFSDDLITFHSQHGRRILIYPQKIESFELGAEIDRKFIRIKNAPYDLVVKNGFFELLVDGKVQLLAKQIKINNRKVEDGKYIGRFVERTFFYLYDGENLPQIRRKKDVFDFLELEKKTLKKTLRRNGLNFKSNKSGYLGFVVDHYNNLQDG
jgi:hypothetical protein